MQSDSVSLHHISNHSHYWRKLHNLKVNHYQPSYINEITYFQVPVETDLVLKSKGKQSISKFPCVQIFAVLFTPD